MTEASQEPELPGASSIVLVPAEEREESCAVQVAVHIRPLIDSERETGCQEGLFVTPGADVAQVGAPRGQSG